MLYKFTTSLDSSTIDAALDDRYVTNLVEAMEDSSPVWRRVEFGSPHRTGVVT
jgi:hypothetical protein